MVHAWYNWYVPPCRDRMPIVPPQYSTRIVDVWSATNTESSPSNDSSALNFLWTPWTDELDDLRGAFVALERWAASQSIMSCTEGSRSGSFKLTHPSVTSVDDREARGELTQQQQQPGKDDIYICGRQTRGSINSSSHRDWFHLTCTHPHARNLDTCDDDRLRVVVVGGTLFSFKGTAHAPLQRLSIRPWPMA